MMDTPEEIAAGLDDGDVWGECRHNGFWDSGTWGLEYDWEEGATSRADGYITVTPGVDARQALVKSWQQLYDDFISPNGAASFVPYEVNGQGIQHDETKYGLVVAAVLNYLSANPTERAFRLKGRIE